MTLNEKALEAEIEHYLQSGGLFNPELMNHAAVRGLILRCRDALSAADAKVADAAQEINRLMIVCGEALRDKEAAEARATSLAAENEKMREALEPFSRAYRAIRGEDGPFRFETARGYRLIEREDLQKAHAALTAPAPGEEPLADTERLAELEHHQ